MRIFANINMCLYFSSSSFNLDINVTPTRNRGEAHDGSGRKKKEDVVEVYVISDYT
jgi:hypothetical protein